MGEHNFVYNYGFLADWRKANPNIKRNELLQSMGMCDYGTLAKWINGNTMMPLAQLMKFCNLWGVPVTAFFMDEKAEDNSIFTPIMENAQIEPMGGWPNNNRKAGIKVCDPRTKVHYSSNLPPYIRTTQHTLEKEILIDDSSDDKDLGNAERMKYLQIIEKLNDRVLDLSQQIIALQKNLSNR